MGNKFDIKVYRVIAAAGLAFSSCASIYTMFLLTKFFEANPNYSLIFQGIAYVGGFTGVCVAAMLLFSITFNSLYSMVKYLISGND